MIDQGFRSAEHPERSGQPRHHRSSHQRNPPRLRRGQLSQRTLRQLAELGRRPRLRHQVHLTHRGQRQGLHLHRPRPHHRHQSQRRNRRLRTEVNHRQFPTRACSSGPCPFPFTFRRESFDKHTNTQAPKRPVSKPAKRAVPKPARFRLFSVAGLSINTRIRKSRKDLYLSLARFRLLSVAGLSINKQIRKPRKTCT